MECHECEVDSHIFSLILLFNANCFVFILFFVFLNSFCFQSCNLLTLVYFFIVFLINDESWVGFSWEGVGVRVGSDRFSVWCYCLFCSLRFLSVFLFLIFRIFSVVFIVFMIDGGFWSLVSMGELGVWQLAATPFLWLFFLILPSVLFFNFWTFCALEVRIFSEVFVINDDFGV